MLWNWYLPRYTSKMKEYPFDELKDEILDALKKLDNSDFFGKGEKNLTVVEGFVYLPIQSTAGGSYNIGGKSLPVVAVVDNTTGQVWQFALKQLVPRVKLI